MIFKRRAVIFTAVLFILTGALGVPECDRSRADETRSYAPTFTPEEAIARARRISNRKIRIRGIPGMYHLKVRCRPGVRCDSRRFYFSAGEYQIELETWLNSERPGTNETVIVEGYFTCRQSGAAMEFTLRRCILIK